MIDSMPGSMSFTDVRSMTMWLYGSTVDKKCYGCDSVKRDREWHITLFRTVDKDERIRQVKMRTKKDME